MQDINGDAAVLACLDLLRHIVVGRPGNEQQHHPFGLARQAILQIAGSDIGAILGAIAGGAELGDAGALALLEQGDFREADRPGERHRHVEAGNAHQRLLVVHRQSAGADLDHQVGAVAVFGETAAEAQQPVADRRDCIFAVGALEVGGIDEELAALRHVGGDARGDAVGGALGGGRQHELLGRSARRVRLLGRRAGGERQRRAEQQPNRSRHRAPSINVQNIRAVLTC